MELTTRTFNKIRGIVYQRSGIALNENKKALVSARIGKRLRALNLTDYEKYLDYLNKDKSGDELVQLLDVISTNVTSFFRENDHYQFIARVFPEWVAAGQRRFRFWSAASSTGEEPYSLAMTLQEANPGKKVDVKILATDISTRVLEQCIRGEYTEKSMKTVSRALKVKYFSTFSEGGENIYRVKDILKKMIVFRRLNLSKSPYPMKGPLDAVFNCNVMIYFDTAGRKKMIDEIYRLLKPGGYLILGHSESLAGIITDFKAVQPSIYIK